MQMRDHVRILMLLFLLWTGGVLGFFSRHFPIANLVEIALNGCMLLILLIFFTAVGRRILRMFQIALLSWAEEWCFAFGLGSGVMMAFVFGLATIGVLSKPLIICLVLALFLLVYQDARQICIQGYDALIGFAFRERPKAETVLLLLMGFAGIISFLAAATPPFFYDALLYHLAVPHKYLIHHGFHFIPHQHFSNLPMNLGMLFLVAMSFSEGMLAQLFSWIYAPWLALAIYAFAKVRWGERIAVTSAAIMFLTPGPLIISTLTSVDCAVMFYAFLSVFALFSWLTSGQTWWFNCSAVLCSIAIGIKYQAIAAFCGLVMIVLLQTCWIEKRSWFTGVRQIIRFGLIVLCGVSPWLIKNIIYTGNPLYPFFHSLFSPESPRFTNYADLMSSVGNPIHAFFHACLRVHPFSWRYWLDFAGIFLKAPWTFTMTITGAAGKTGVVFLLCLPGLFLIRMDRAVQHLAVFSGCAFGVWMFLLPWVQRYGFVMLPSLSLVTAYILWRIPVAPRGRRLLMTALNVLLFYHLLLFLSEEVKILRPFAYLFGNVSKEEFLLEHGVNYYPVLQTELASNAKILFVGESRGYYCPRDYVLYAAVEGIDDNEIPLRKLIVASQNFQELLQRLQHLGITHIMVNFAEMNRFTKQYLKRDSYFGFQTQKDQSLLSALFSPQHARLVRTQSQVNLYEVLYPEKSL